MRHTPVEMSHFKAYDELMWFVQQRGETALRLAMHAAVPQSFRVDLLHLLRLNFLLDEARDPGVEADVLLAPFCKEIGHGYFQFDPEVRRLLLDQLDETYAQEAESRLRRVAAFLLSYIEHISHNFRDNQDRLAKDYLQIQLWVALAFLEPDTAAEQLAAAERQQRFSVAYTPEALVRLVRHQAMEVSGLRSKEDVVAEEATSPAPEKAAPVNKIHRVLNLIERILGKVGLGPPQPGAVLLGTSAPQSVRAGDEFTARFVAYVPQMEEQVRELLQGLSPRSTVHLGERTCRWLLGARVKVRLTGQFVAVNPPEDEFIWEGTSSRVEFDVKADAEAPDGVVVLKFDLSVNGEPVRGPRLDLTIIRAEEAAVDYKTATVSAPETAFASYASADRLRVLDRVDSLRINVGLDVFLDCLSLHPNDQWKPTLEKEIKNRDLFLLFWSTPAANSPWVEWEWQTALHEKGEEAMQIHPLEYGLTPPEPLRDIHFGDHIMAVREAEMTRRGKERG